MAYCLLRGCHQRYDIKGLVGTTANPTTWFSLADLCQDFAKCLNSTGETGPRVLIHVFLPGTRISLDIGDGEFVCCEAVCVVVCSVVSCCHY